MGTDRRYDKYTMYLLKAAHSVTFDILIFELKPHSHCAGVATVHPDAGQPVYRDAPGHIS